MGSANAVFVEGHADSGVHADFFKCADFTGGGDATSRDDGMFCGTAQGVEPAEIRASHGAFAVDVGAQEAHAVGGQGCENFTGIDCELGAPAVSNDAASGGIEGHDEMLFADAGGQAFEEREVWAAISEGGAADDDVSYSKLHQCFRPGYSADATSDPDLHTEPAVRFDRELADQAIIVAFAHGGIEIDDVQPFIAGEALE